MLKGQAKKDYQKTYMREYMRAKRQVVKTPQMPDVKTSTHNDNYDITDSTLYVPELDAEGQPIPEY